MALFLGLDLSTQSLKATIVDVNENLIAERTVVFHRDLQHYKTQNGAIAGPDGEMTSPIAMWVESLDILMNGFAEDGHDLSAIAAVSGAAQQHGSVYWTGDTLTLMRQLNSSRSLLEQLIPNAFSLPNAPIWQDSSTTKECRELEMAVGGPQNLADMTGSRAYERFTASQITKIRRTKPDTYERTERISLVSSFLASLFLCRYAPIEMSDASGMNLMSISTRQWDEKLVSACGGTELRSKLGEEPVLGGVSLGNIGQYWVDRYNFNSDCIVAPFTGDNPSTIVTLSSPGDAILSLGTSTTLLVSVPPPSETVSAPNCSTSSHILAHPTTPQGSIYMLCIKNGGLTRDLVRDKYSSHSWSEFNSEIESRPPGNDGYIGFYFTLKEIIPDGVQGDHFFQDGKRVDEASFPREAHARAVLESQLLSVRARLAATFSSTDGAGSGLRRCILTGGASHNTVFQQVVADVLGLPVFIASSGGGSAASGGALLAKYAWWTTTKDSSPRVLSVSAVSQEKLAVAKTTTAPFEEMRSIYGGFAVQRVAEPDAENAHVYGDMLAEFERCEQFIVDEMQRHK